ncbi:hypothetical protein JCM19240_6803 [Vibrio maritimus]|uniref:Uncharacterized protein n=1 Tax=Vibrio maritimus TaxID=990268 RepID=A0A090TCG2_9VIBR|nr:hypothetical protein JCM19240_6803 [Vibrio maritimus]
MVHRFTPKTNTSQKRSRLGYIQGFTAMADHIQNRNLRV